MPSSQTNESEESMIPTDRVTGSLQETNSDKPILTRISSKILTLIRYLGVSNPGFFKYQLQQTNDIILYD
jgi:hypothetical protein